MMEKEWNTNLEVSPNCPRCGSSNTKFCYYNNYSLTQPRYFCKGCRRYWTKGGSLRNVPVGGGCRKNRRPKPSSKSMRYGVVPIDPFVNSNSPKGNSSSSSMVSNGSHIDLAIVYANFLNQKPEIPECTNMDSSIQLPDENIGLRINGSNNHELAPLPGEEVVESHEFYFPNSTMVFPNLSLHQLESEAHHPTSSFTCNWTGFDFSGYENL